MPSPIEELIGSVLRHYPDHRSDDLSVARLTKVLFLIDWRAAIVNQGSASERSLTGLEWRIARCGPDRQQVLNVLETSKYFKLVDTDETYPFRYVVRQARNGLNELPDSDLEIVRHVLSVTTDRTWVDLLRLVDATFPMLAADDNEPLDLMALAADYARYQAV